MFYLGAEKLEELGASITTQEIKQQPDLWEETYSIYKDKKQEIDQFLNKISEKYNHVRVIFSGAGTSAYVGETVLPYLKGKLDETKWELISVPTTSLVSNPYHYFKNNIPTILVSFARSGNSPESIATVNLAQQMVDELYQITITCSAEGKLAQNSKGDDRNLLLLMPEKSNDKGFAMTGSYTCMTLTSLLIFDELSETEEEKLVTQLIKLGENVVDRVEEIQDIVDTDFDRIIYLGSGSLEGLSREAQLKVLELTAGKVSTFFDSSLGFRHGPKSFVNEKSLIFVFVSNNQYTRKYDLDMLAEMKADNIANKIYAVEVDCENNFDGDSFQFDESAQFVPDAYLVLPFAMFAQTISLISSVKVGNKPDTPSPTGTVNRVVQGVTIHPFVQREE